MNGVQLLLATFSFALSFVVELGVRSELRTNERGRRDVGSIDCGCVGCWCCCCCCWWPDDEEELKRSRGICDSISAGVWWVDCGGCGIEPIDELLADELMFIEDWELGETWAEATGDGVCCCCTAVVAAWFSSCCGGVCFWLLLCLSQDISIKWGKRVFFV